MWVTFASGYQAVYQALILVLASIILYAFLNARRERLGQIPEPADNPRLTIFDDPAAKQDSLDEIPGSLNVA
jgi:hypothetical protein